MCRHSENTKTLLIDKDHSQVPKNALVLDVRVCFWLCRLTLACLRVYVFLYVCLFVCVCDVVMSQLCYRNREALCPHD